jgi:hypothetical protein
LKGYERAAPAGDESQLADSSPVFAAGGIPISIVANHSRITRTQQGKPRLQTLLDLRCVYRPRTYGLHEERTASLKAYANGSWYCYGCHQGGSIFDFAARLTAPRDTRRRIR